MTAANPSLPQFCPPHDVLDDLELLRSGILAPEHDVAPGGPVSVHLPAEVAVPAQGAGGVEIVDPEGVPFARLAATGTSREDGSLDLQARPEWTGRPSPRTFERFYVSPKDNAADLAADTVSVVVDRPIKTDDLLDIVATAGKRPLQFLVLAGPSHSPHSPAVTTIRSALTAVSRLRRGHVVALPIDPRAARAKRERAVAAYASGEVISLEPMPGEARRHGLVLFFTGLSGSGKSTIARSVRDQILEEGERSVTLLDGDLVRRHLSAGLTFSAADRETNIRRIGWVGAEISRHGGIAICSPIAPFATTRETVRQMVTEAGGDFLLIHVATPLAECERRDRKGLYAKARRGEIPEFTGISSPYEEPADADLVLDTTGITIDAAVERVVSLLRARGHLKHEEVLEWAI
ncbi:MAG: adenylyl-sulfate kinase [Tetrasphaera sp.]